MLDNGSRDGSAQAAREHATVDETIALDERRGKALNDSELLRRARGRYALLLNEDSELLPGATLALCSALEGARDAACAGARCCGPTGAEQPSAWRFPDAADGARRRAAAAPPLTVQSRGERDARGRLVPVGGAARAPRGGRAGRLAGRRLLRLLRRGRLRAPAARRRLAQLYVPGAAAIHHEQLSTGAVPERRIVEIARNRDLYMRKHHSPAAALRGALADRVDVRAARAGRAGRCPATRRGATGATSPRRCARRAARGCARRPSATTASARASDRSSASSGVDDARMTPSAPVRPSGPPRSARRGTAAATPARSASARPRSSICGSATG